MADDNDRLTQLEEGVADHLNDLLKEIVRRDEWLIHSIWNVVRGLSTLAALSGTWFIVWLNDIKEPWQIALVIGACIAVIFVQSRNNDRLEKDDLRRIGASSLLSPFASWWR